MRPAGWSRWSAGRHAARGLPGPCRGGGWGAPGQFPPQVSGVGADHAPGAGAVAWRRMASNRQGGCAGDDHVVTRQDRTQGLQFGQQARRDRCPAGEHIPPVTARPPPCGSTRPARGGPAIQRDRRLAARIAQDSPVTPGDSRDLPPVPEITKQVVRGDTGGDEWSVWRVLRRGSPSCRAALPAWCLAVRYPIHCLADDASPSLAMRNCACQPGWG